MSYTKNKNVPHGNRNIELCTYVLFLLCTHAMSMAIGKTNDTQVFAILRVGNKILRILYLLLPCGLIVQYEYLIGYNVSS